MNLDKKMYIYFNTCFCFGVFYDSLFNDTITIFIGPIVIAIVKGGKGVDLFGYIFGSDNQSISRKHKKVFKYC